MPALSVHHVWKPPGSTHSISDSLQSFSCSRMQNMSPANYQTAVSKGRKLVELMQSKPASPCSTSGSMNFTQADLVKWGWTSRRYGAEEILDEHADFLRAIGTDTYVRQHPYDGTGGDSIDLTCSHSNPVTIDTKLFPATEGYFSSVMNWKAGLLIAVNNSSPESRAKRKQEKSSTANANTLISLPPLRHWSDIAYLQWRQLPDMGVKPSPLRYILRANVQNPLAVDIMSRVLGFYAGAQTHDNRKPKRPRWPGRSFKISTWDAQALLGTPNGRGVGYFVAQHGREFGAGPVEMVTIYFTDDGYWEKSNILFWLGDVCAEQDVKAIQAAT